MGLKTEYDYCEKSDVYKLLHPESVMENYFIFNDFTHQELPREIIKDFGVDMIPKAWQQNNLYKKSLDIPLETTYVFSRTSRVHHFLEFGKCLFCLF